MLCFASNTGLGPCFPPFPEIHRGGYGDSTSCFCRFWRIRNYSLEPHPFFISISWLDQMVRHNMPSVVSPAAWHAMPRDFGWQPLFIRWFCRQLITKWWTFLCLVNYQFSKSIGWDQLPYEWLLVHFSFLFFFFPLGFLLNCLRIHQHFTLITTVFWSSIQISSKKMAKKR